MKTIKLAYLVSTLGRTGPTQQLYNLIKHLNQDQFQPVLITLSPNPCDNLESEFSRLRIGMHSLHLTRLGGVVMGTSRLTKLLEKFQPDILHSQGLRADWFSSSLPKRQVRIATQRNNPLNDYPALYGWLKGTVAAQMHIHALSRLPVVVACSRAIADTNSRRYLATRVIRNGIDLGVTSTLLSDNEKQARRRELNLPATGRLFVYAGPLIRRKEPKLLVRAFLDCAKPKDALVLLGDGPLLTNCRRLAKATTNILLPGPVDCVATYLQAADFFVSASRAEGMPNAVLEALSAGLPVILSDIAPHQEILALSPKAGWQFEMGNQRALSERIDRAQASLENRHAARHLAEQHFSAKDMSDAYQGLYHETMRMGKSRH